MISLPTISLAALVARSILVHASPLDSRNNDGKYKYKSKCEGFAVSGIDDVLQAVDSIYYSQGALVNLTSGQQTLVASDVPCFCSEHFRLYMERSASVHLQILKFWRVNQEYSSWSTPTLLQGSSRIQKFGFPTNGMADSWASEMVDMEVAPATKIWHTRASTKVLQVGCLICGQKPIPAH
jgi:hypothetical protein